MSDESEIQKISVVTEEELGISGNLIRSSRFYDEYLGALQTNEVSYDKYDKMRRGDYEIKRAIRAIKTPLQRASYSFIPSDAEDEEQIKQCEFKNSLFKKWLSRKWTVLFNEMFTYLVFGFALFEKVYEVRDTKEFGKVITLKKLAYRKQKTIRKWYFDESNDFSGVNQFVSTNGKVVDVTIPKEKIFLLTNELEGSNLEGISLLREAYGSWKRKDLFLRADMIGIEKNAVGTPIAFVSSAILDNAKEKTVIRNALENYVLHQKNYLLLPDSMKDGGFIIQKGEYNSDAVNKSIRREDFAIISSILANFLDIGTLQSGGNSQSDTLKQMFLNSIEYIGQYICECLSELAHEVYLLNYPEPDIKIDMTCSGISDKNLKELSEIVKDLGASKFITPTVSTEIFLRKKFNLNEIPYEEIIEAREKANSNKNKSFVDDEDKNDNKIKNSDSCCGPSKIKLETKRELTEYEKSINIEAVRGLFQSSEDDVRLIIKKNLSKMQTKYLNDLEVALNQSNPVSAIDSIEIGYTGQLTKELKEHLTDTYKKAQRQAMKELKTAVELESDGKVKRIAAKITFTVKQIVKTIIGDFENNSSLVAINGLDRGDEVDNIVDSVDVALTAYITGKSPYASIGATVNKNINNGRNNVFWENTNIIQGFQFSSVIDSNTSDICFALDRRIFLPEDAKGLQFRPPLHWGCRSILVPIVIGQPEPTITGLEITQIERNGKVIGVDEILKSKQF